MPTHLVHIAIISYCDTVPRFNDQRVEIVDRRVDFLYNCVDGACVRQRRFVVKILKKI